jgi:rod shape-determining protein MreC
LAVLVAISLLLITVYFRESNGGVLHNLQGTGSTILRPFEIGADRVARPFRDLYNYVSGLVNAKSQRDKLQAELDVARQQIIQLRFASQENQTLRTSLRYISGPSFPKDYRAVTAAIISKPPSPFEQQVVIGAGSSSGIQSDDPVVNADGNLAGKVTKVFPDSAQVTLLTDEVSAASGIDIHTTADGIVRHGQGPGSSLFLDMVPKSKQIGNGDTIVTTGWHSGKLSSIYPKGIPIGTVSHAVVTDTSPYVQVQVTPFVDFGSLDSVTVLVARKPSKLR